MTTDEVEDDSNGAQEVATTNTPVKQPVSSSSNGPALGIFTLVSATTVALVAILVAIGSRWALVMVLTVSVTANLILVFLNASLSKRAAALETRLTPEGPLKGSEKSALDVEGGLQGIVDAAWGGWRDAVAQLEPSGIVTRVELSESSPKVMAVREAALPADGVLGYEVDLAWHDHAQLLVVDLNIKLLGTLRVKLVRLESSVQVYLWSSPPKGRGDGLPYSLVEASFAPAPPRPAVVGVDLEAGSSSGLLQQILPRMQQVVAAVVDELLLPRLTGFQHRVVVYEEPPSGSQQVGEDDADDSWQKVARRAGWLPRGEAELENAVGELLRRATGYAWERASGAGDALQGKLAAGLEAGQRARERVSGAAADAATVVSDAAVTVVQKPTEHVAAAARAGLGAGFEASQWARERVSGAASGAATVVSDAAVGAATVVQKPTEHVAAAARAGLGAGFEASQWARDRVTGAASGAATVVSDAAVGAATVVQKPTEHVAAAARAGLEAGQWAQQLVSGAAAGAVTAIQNPGEQAAQAARAAADAAAGAAAKFGISLDMLRSQGQSPEATGASSEALADAQPEQPQL